MFCMNMGADASNRLDWVDTSKGIGIILVILGHIWLSGLGQKYISSFHMPLFFLLSGYVFSFEKYRDVKHFLGSKVKRILIPYAWFSLITYVYWVLFERRVSGNMTSPVSTFINIVLCPGTDKYLPHNPALWFLPCLFVVEVMFYFIAKNRKHEYLSIILLLISIVGYIIARYAPGNFPWSINVALAGVVFYGIGFVIKSNRKCLNCSNRIIHIAVLTAVTVGLFIAMKNTRVLMAACVYGDYFYFYSAALMNIIGIIALSFLLRKNKWLVYLGRHSLTIYALHFPVKRLVVGMSGIFFNAKLEQIHNSFMMSAIDTIITILILLPIIYLIRTRFSFILGLKESH